ncbi:MAG TPA: class F sortase [Trebonia sp.]
MATIPRRDWRRIACGLAVAVTALIVVLAGESAAAAAAGAPYAHPAGQVRDIRPDAQAAARGRAPQGKQRTRAARPWMIEIPSIGVTAGLMTLGGPSTASGSGDLTLPVPPLAKAAVKAGWYRFTAVPGTLGNAVIVGHVDTYLGPAVFYDLYRLRPGQSVYVSVGRTRRRFDVTSVREMSKSHFPVNQVFGPTKKHALWLITCGGAFDYKTGHYLDNIAVSATWVPAPRRPAVRQLRAKPPEIQNAGTKVSANN